MNKTLRLYDQSIGNLMFGSIRTLKHEQTRYQDDIESLAYVAYFCIFGTLPWQVQFGMKNMQGRQRNFRVEYKGIRVQHYHLHEKVIYTKF